jgi:hypothetical protein
MGRRGLLALGRSVLVVAGLVVVYVLLPLDRPFQVGFVLEFVAGLIAVAGLLVWQLRSIARATMPGVRAVEAVTLSLTVFLLLFAVTYELLSGSDPQAFNEPLSRLDALYFVVTVFATVGFGDIVPVSEPARAITTLQMVLDLVAIGLGLRAVVSAVDRGRKRAAEQRPPD